jgi:hypothetical protein
MALIRYLRAQWDRVAAFVALVAGGAALVAGWFGASGSGYPAEQLPYVISGGLGGLFLLGLGATLWLSADLRDEWRKLDRVEEALRQVRAASEVQAPEKDGAIPEARGERGAMPAKAVGREAGRRLQGRDGGSEALGSLPAGKAARARR